MISSDFAEIWTHDNILALAETLCDAYGWKVDGEMTSVTEGRGVLEIYKEKFNGTKTSPVLIPYGLPESSELLSNRIRRVLQAKDR